MQHPNIVRFLGKYTSAANESFMVMEYVAKGSLLSVLKKEGKVLTFQDRVDMMITGCRGMVYLEAKNIIHRDISAR